MGKHAYLILAHKNWGQLKVLLSLLDNRRNDIFLHVDKKKYPPQNVIEEIAGTPQVSDLYFVDSINVNWGSYSVIAAELILLKAAIQVDHYDYYHLISGQDLPLKTQKEIHSYFDQHQGEEFVEYADKSWMERVKKRYRYYRFFQEQIGRENRRVLQKLERIGIRLQRAFHINRIRGLVFSGGPNWFSVTDEFARLVCANSKKIKKQFRFTQCADECFLQMFSIETGFDRKSYQILHKKNSGNMRFVDWDRGSPYTFRIDDFEDLIHSEKLFARKFDITVDAEIIEKIYAHLSGERSR